MIEIKWNAKQCGVYCIRNKVNGKQYIGSSVNCYHRIKSQHLARLRNGTHTNPHLQSSFRKYGEKAFEYFIVKLCIEKNMLIQEQLHIDSSKCLDRRFGYNINTKAEKTILTNEQREKIRLSKLGKKRSKKKTVGVYKSGKNWMARIGFHGKEFYLGIFKLRRDAELVYQNALKRVIDNQDPDSSVADKIRISKDKPVVQRTLEGEFVKRFPSLQSVELEGYSQNTVWRYCSGRTKTPRNYIWEYE